MNFLNSTTRSIGRLALLPLLLLGCAESPNSPVAPFDRAERGSEGHKTTLPALKFDGQMGLALSCQLFIAKEDEHILIKVVYRSTDGHSPQAAHAEFFLYDRNTATYYPPESNEPETRLALSSVLSIHEGEELDRNRLSEHLAKNEVLQSIHIDFLETSERLPFLDSLEVVLSEPALIEDHRLSLDQVDAAEIISLHGDHYHSSLCRNYKFAGVEETEFEFDHDHD